VNRDIPIAVAGGGTDALTATFNPAITLTDGLVCLIEINTSGANATTNPTFNPNGLGALTIVRDGGATLMAGDIPGDHAICMLAYNLAHTRWELLNPRTSFQIVIAGGIADAITATFSPAITLTDKTIFAVEALLANATTTPTLAVNGTAARTITKQGGAALAVGDIPAEHAFCIFAYNLAHTRYELLNPATVRTAQILAPAASLIIKPTSDAVTAIQIADKDGNVILNVDTTNDRVGIGTVAPVSLLEIQGGATDVGAVFTLGTAETMIMVGDILGRINFYGPKATEGGDANVVSASIAAICELLFDATHNETGLQFSTGASEVAVERMRIDHLGNVGIGKLTPLRLLHINAAAAEASIILSRADGLANNKNWRILSDNAGAGTGGEFYIDLLNDVGNAITKSALMIDHTGYVGIGPGHLALAPTRQLTVCGVGVLIHGNDAAGAEYEDWPNPSLAIRRSETVAAFTQVTMISLGFRDDAVYFTDASIAVIRLKAAAGALTSSSATSLMITSPGPLSLGSGGVEDRLYIDAAKVCINGGLHVGGTSDPGDNNLEVDGTIVGSNVKSGTYTPTIAKTAGTPVISASTVHDAWWIRVGNVVIVCGGMNIDTDVGGIMEYTITLPADGSGAATFGDAHQAWGIDAMHQMNVPSSIQAVSGTRTVYASVIFPDGSDRIHTYMFGYNVP
jgi:hypothetical protein